MVRIRVGGGGDCVGGVVAEKDSVDAGGGVVPGAVVRDGCGGGRGLDPGRRVKGRGGFNPEMIAEVRESGGSMPVAEALRCRARYFTDGVVPGSQEFVDGFCERRGGDFGTRRKNGSRRMKDAAWGELRALKDDVISTRRHENERAGTRGAVAIKTGLDGRSRGGCGSIQSRARAQQSK